MVLVTLIEEMRVPIYDGEFCDKNRRPLGLSAVTEQPCVVTFTSGGSREVVEINYQLVVDPLTAMFRDLSTADEVDVPANLCRCRPHASARCEPVDSAWN